MMSRTDHDGERERIVHIDLPRITPEQMTTSHPVEPPPDPTGGRDVETEFMIRHIAW